MNRNFFNILFSYSLVVTVLLILPGCSPLDWFKDKLNNVTPINKTLPIVVEKAGTKVNSGNFAEKYGVKNDNSPVLARLDGVPVVTKKTLELQKKLLFESNPQYESYAKMVGPDVFDKQLTEALASRALYGRWCFENKINEKEEYKQECARAQESIEDMLNTKYFSEHLKVNASDKDIREFYDKFKDQIPGIRISAGGVKAAGVSFDSEKAAQDFLAKAKENRGDIKKTAQQAAVAEDKIKDWGLIRQDSTGINDIVKNKIIDYKLFPTIDIIKVTDNDVWVVSASSKEEPKYKALEEVKQQLKKSAEEQKMTEAFEKATQKYRDEYKLELSEDYFKPEEPVVAPIAQKQPTPAPKKQSAAPKQVSKTERKTETARAA